MPIKVRLHIFDPGGHGGGMLLVESHDETEKKKLSTPNQPLQIVVYSLYH